MRYKNKTVLTIKWNSYILDIMRERLETFSGGNEAIEFGPKNTHPVFLSCINEIEQIRKTYPADKIEDLANAIEQVDPSTKEVDFDLSS